MTKTTCDLCGLSLRHGAVNAVISEKPMQFCCFGCKQVYEMLLAASGDLDPDAFRETEIFKRCVAAGIIPESMDDLEKKRQSSTSAKEPVRALKPGITDNKSMSESDKGLWLDLNVRGMWCPACAWVVEEALIKEPGVKQAKCQFTTDRIKLNYNPVLTSPQHLMGAIEKLGYHGSPAEDGQKKSESKREFVRLGISAFLTMNVMMLSFALYTGFFYPALCRYHPSSHMAYCCHGFGCLFLRWRPNSPQGLVRAVGSIPRNGNTHQYGSRKCLFLQPVQLAHGEHSSLFRHRVHVDYPGIGGQDH